MPCGPVGRRLLKRLAESVGLWPYFRQLDGEVGPRMRFDGRSVIMLGSNNYLGLTTDGRVRAAAVDD